MEILAIVAATIVGGFLAGIGGAYVQGRFQLKEAREAEARLSERLQQVERAIARLDPVKLARQLFHRGQYVAAVETCTSVLATEPDNAEAYQVRGQAHAELRESEKAVTDLRSAVNRGMRRGDVYLALALSELALGHWTEAAGAARCAVDPSVDQPTTDIALALTVLGDALRAGGQFNDAISVYEQCLERFPVHTPAIDGAGVAKLGLADRGLLSHDEVIEWYDRHVQANPRAASTITNRGVALMRRNRPGDEAQAFRDFENAAAVSDRRTAPYEAAGRMLLEKAEGDEDSSTRLSQAGQALKAFQQAFQRATAYYQPAIRNWLSYTYQVLGQCDDAIRQAEDSVQRSPGFPANHQALCCAFLACSQWNRAAAAANEWLTSEYAAQSLPSRIWMGGFLCLAKLCAGADRSAMLDDLHALHSDRLLMPWSGARWKWSPAKQRVLEHMRGKGENQQLAQDIVGLLEGGVSPESFRQRWLR